MQRQGAEIETWAAGLFASEIDLDDTLLSNTRSKTDLVTQAALGWAILGGFAECVLEVRKKLKSADPYLKHRWALAMEIAYERIVSRPVGPNE